MKYSGESAKYTVKGYAARNGNPMGFLRTLIFPDGSGIGDRGSKSEGNS